VCPENSVTQEFSAEDHRNIYFDKNRVYEHSKFRIHYTTYDVQREQDVINLRTHSDIMLLGDIDSSDSTTGHTTHLYRYAQVLGIFHVYERHRAMTSTAWSEKQQIEILWVHWFRINSSQASGWTAARLPAVTFIMDDADGTNSYGFMNPQDVICSAHIIPAFDSDDIGTDFLDDSTRRSVAHSHKENEESGRENFDYGCYYVNM